MLIIASQVRNARLEFSEPDYPVTTIGGRQLRFAEGANALSNYFGLTPAIAALEPPHDLARIGIQASVHDISHTVYNTGIVYATANDRISRLRGDFDRESDGHDISAFMSLTLPGLEGKTAIVTGHARGIGRAVYDLLAESGCAVRGIDLPEHDLGEIDRIAGWVDAIAAETGRIDILVNNAGITNVGDILETPFAEVEEVLTVNVKAPFMMIKAVLPHMLKQKSGSIVNNASDQALIGKRRSAIYGASKAALAQLTKSAALDWGPHGIRCNCIAPGSTDTPMLRRVLGELHERYPDLYPKDNESFYKESIALERFAAPKEIAWLVAFLASDASSFMTGTVIPIDGGYTAQ